MILSASRRTDIPNYYSEWFYNRIREGFLYVRNPMNAHQISRIDLSPEVVDCIVFWTKNPEPMMDRLDEINAYPYYFQFTLTGYGADVERNVPHKKKVMIPIFQKLSERIGSQRVIWRYDPIIFTGKYTPEYHLRAFQEIAGSLKGYTEKCVISFVDRYAKIQRELDMLGMEELDQSNLLTFAKALSRIAGENGMEIATCAEKMDLQLCGIKHNCCIDEDLIERIIGCKIHGRKDKGQREACGCLESVEIGTYHTCRNGCVYCYANQGWDGAKDGYHPDSPLLCGEVMEGDRVTAKKMKSIREGQLSLDLL